MFGLVAPDEAVRLAAEQHDIGWIAWESAPTLNPETGYPYSFMEVAPEVHTELWKRGKTPGNADGTVCGTAGFAAWDGVG